MVKGHEVRDVAERFVVLGEGHHRVFVDEVARRRELLLDAVHVEHLVAVFDRVARHAHDALDVVDRRIDGITEDDHVAALGSADFQNLRVGDRQTQTVVVLVDEDEVTHVQGR